MENFISWLSGKKKETRDVEIKDFEIKGIAKLDHVGANLRKVYVLETSPDKFIEVLSKVKDVEINIEHKPTSDVSVVNKLYLEVQPDVMIETDQVVVDYEEDSHKPDVLLAIKKTGLTYHSDEGIASWWGKYK